MEEREEGDGERTEEGEERESVEKDVRDGDFRVPYGESHC